MSIRWWAEHRCVSTRLLRISAKCCSHLKSSIPPVSRSAARFDLVVSPLFDDGVLTGYLVEWKNAITGYKPTSSKAGSMRSSGRRRSLSSISMARSLDANKNFLDALGYKLDRDQGHASCDVRSSPNSRKQDYKAFWRAQARRIPVGEYLRLGKAATGLDSGLLQPDLRPGWKRFKVVKYDQPTSPRGKKRSTRLSASLVQLAKAISMRASIRRVQAEFEPVRDAPQPDSRPVHRYNHQDQLTSGG